MPELNHMTDRVEDRDESFQWSGECPDRYEITLYFSNGDEYIVPKYIKKLICTYAEIKKMTLKDYIWSNHENLQNSLQGLALDKLVDVKITDKNDYTEEILQRLVDKNFNKCLDKKTKLKSSIQTKLPESQGHVQLKHDIVEFLKNNGIEAYPEVVFYENARNDFYAWQRQERLKNSKSDGVFGYGNVGFGNYRQGYGQQIRVDVAGWIGKSYGKFDYPIIAIEVMKSSNLREEIIGLKKIQGISAVYTVVVDVLDQLNGQINRIPVVPLNVFKVGIIKRLEMAKNAIKDRKGDDDIFAIGKKYNVGKID